MFKFKARYKANGAMNKLESEYSSHLNMLKKADQIIDYRYEAIKLRLADRTFYTPDFLVIKENSLEFHETKGFWHDDARVKIKVAAEQYPHFKFIAIQKKKKQWVVEEF